MSVAVIHLLEKALLNQAEPSREFLDHQLGIVSARMQRVQQGASSLTDAEEAHDQVLLSLKVHS